MVGYSNRNQTVCFNNIFEGPYKVHLGSVRSTVERYLLAPDEKENGMDLQYPHTEFTIDSDLGQISSMGTQGLAIRGTSSANAAELKALVITAMRKLRPLR